MAKIDKRLVSKEIQRVMLNNKIGQREFGEAVGATEAQVSNWINQKAAPSLKTIHRIMEVYPDFSVVEQVKTIKDEKKSLDLPVYPQPAPAGRMSRFEDMPETPMFYIKTIFPKAQFAVPVYGDSMYPNYPKSALAACRLKEDLSYIAYGEVYLVVGEEETFLKRVYPGDDQSFELRSDNSESYPPFRYPKSKVLHMYFCEGCIRPDRMQNVIMHS